MKKKIAKQLVKNVSELRRDPVSGDWVVIATGRAKRPNTFAQGHQHDPAYESKENCPFENPQVSGNDKPILVFDHKAREMGKLSQDWFVQVIPNRFPAFAGPSVKRYVKHVGPYTVLEGRGSHEVVIMREHTKNISSFSSLGARAVIYAYMARFNILSLRPNVRYVSIFHNFGKEAGASLYHPHSQIMAIPVVPPDVARSLAGSQRYFQEKSKCVHCEMIAWEKKDNQRIVFENEHFIAICPFVSRAAFEIRIFPKKHESSFKDMGDEEIGKCADALRITLGKLEKALANPDYNFFIHTSPINIESLESHFYPHYHWHIEILPKTAIWAGFELGTGIEISTIKPENAAKFLRKFNVS